MFDSISNSLNKVFDALSRKKFIGEDDLNAAMREIRVALLEADVSLSVAKEFIKDRMRQHVEDLKKKDYAKNKLEELDLKESKNATITTIMFIQTERMLEIINRADEKLITKALENNIQIMSTSGLINSLNDAKRRIDHFNQEKNLEEIKKIIKNIIDSIHRMAQKSQAMGKSIKAAANRYDEFLGTFGRTISYAKKVNELGIESDKKNLEIKLEKIGIGNEVKIIDHSPEMLELEHDEN